MRTLRDGVSADLDKLKEKEHGKTKTIESESDDNGDAGWKETGDSNESSSVVTPTKVDERTSDKG